MGENTAISWCDHTHNMWEGCEKISPGCKHCYAATMNAWLRKGENWEPGGPRRTFKPAHYRKPLAWNKAAQAEGRRHRVFCGSVMDIMEIHRDADTNAMLDELRNSLWDLILSTPWLDWLLLTKRIENADDILPWGKRGGFASPFRNVWIGVTAEDQEYADKRIPLLRTVDAVKRFVSYEPALGPIDWTAHLAGANHPNWVIFGDESGRNRRDAQLAWARATRDACAAAGVAFHLKQLHHEDPAVAGDRDKKGKIHLPILDGAAHPGFPA